MQPFILFVSLFSFIFLFLALLYLIYQIVDYLQCYIFRSSRFDGLRDLEKVSQI